MIPATLQGGPVDGRAMVLAGPVPPFEFRVPVPSPAVERPTDSARPSGAFRVAEYRLVHWSAGSLAVYQFERVAGGPHRARDRCPSGGLRLRRCSLPGWQAPHPRAQRHRSEVPRRRQEEALTAIPHPAEPPTYIYRVVREDGSRPWGTRPSYTRRGDAVRIAAQWGAVVQRSIIVWEDM